MGAGVSTRKEVDNEEAKIDREIKRINKMAPRQKEELKSELNLAKHRVPFSYVSQTGYYPDALGKANQDAFIVHQIESDLVLFGVFDGHGKVGDLCSQFVRDEIIDALHDEPDFKERRFYNSLLHAFEKVNINMHQQEKTGYFSDMMSGTTAITVLFDKEEIYVANVGDSRAIGVAELKGKLVAVPLSIDQTPFRKDERERVKLCGARVLTMSQLEGYVDSDDDDYGDEDNNDGDPPRLWCDGGKYPGTAFTRSIGDRVAEDIGVTATPEVLHRKLTKEDKYIIVASDGVFEFISSQMVVEIFERNSSNLLVAARAIVAEAYRRWLQFDVRTDDITCVIINVENLGNSCSFSAQELVDRTEYSAIDNLAVEIAAQHAKYTNKKLPEQRVTVSRYESFKLDQTEAVNSKPQSIGLRMRPVRRKVANDVGVVKLDPSELEGYTLPQYLKSAEETSNLFTALTNCYLFSHLSEIQMKHVILAMEKIPCKSGDVIIQQFDQGDRFYVAESGTYAVEVQVNKSVEDHEGKQVVLQGEYHEPRYVMDYVCEPGAPFPTFGELALMYNKPRAASVKANTDGVLWALERKAFHSVIKRDNPYTLIKVFKRVPAFSKLSTNEITHLVDNLTHLDYKPGEDIVKQGDVGDAFYVIKSGNAQVTVKQTDGSDVEVMRISNHGTFGERALLDSAPRAATVSAIDHVSCLMINKKLFDQVLKRLEGHIRGEARRRETIAISYLEVKSLEHLRIFQGSFPLFSSTAYRCAIRSNPMVFCTLRRIELENEETKSVLLKEMTMLQTLATPTFISTFEHPSYPSIIYSLYKDEFVSDLHTIIHERPMGPSSNMLKYTVWSVMNALVQLHQTKGIISRCINPESILLTNSGDILLTDFRFAKKTDGLKTYTACGVPEYMAPEQVTGSGHGFAVDWWALGILIFELTQGKTPFGNQSESEMYGDITNEIEVNSKIGKIASSIDLNLLKFIKELLKQKNRFECTDSDEIRSVPWLSKFNPEESPFKQIASSKTELMMKGND